MPARKVSHHGKNIIGAFPSLKAAEPPWYESTIERDLYYYLEFDPAVITYRSQPFTIEAPSHHYTPDVEIIRIDGREIVECKPSDLKDEPNTQRQVAMGSSWAAKNNYIFTLVTDNDLRSGACLKSLKLLWRYSRLNVPCVVTSTCLNYLTSQPNGMSFLELAEHLTDHEPLAQSPYLYSLLFQHTIYTDLNRPLSVNSVLYAQMPNTSNLTMSDYRSRVGDWKSRLEG